MSRFVTYGSRALSCGIRNGANPPYPGWLFDCYFVCGFPAAPIILNIHKSPFKEPSLYWRWRIQGCVCERRNDIVDDFWVHHPASGSRLQQLVSTARLSEVHSRRVPVSYFSNISIHDMFPLPFPIGGAPFPSRICMAPSLSSVLRIF